MPAATASSPFARAVAWLGGAVFVASLLYTAWWFTVLLATPAAGATGSGAAIVGNVALFSVFALHHSVMARTRAKRWLLQVVPPGLERSVYVWVASLLLIAVCTSWRRVPGVLYRADGVVAWLLLGVQVTGVVLTLAAARVLDALELAGIRQAHGVERPSAIRVIWPFTLVRHPIYLGWLLMVFGAAPMTVDRLVFAVTSTVYLLISMPWEERSLSAAAGPAYSAYCLRVRWRLVPRLY